MSTFNLEKLFNPKSIAVIGASPNVGTAGEVIVRNIQNYNFTGTVWPVNPKYQNVRGIACTEFLESLDAVVDLAIIATPIPTVPKILKTCVQKKIPAALILSDARRMAGQAGKKIEADIARIAQEGNIRVMGPNSLGIINQSAGLNITYSPTMPKPGKMAFVSQSGSIFTATLDMAFQEQFGFSYFINVGAMVDIDFGDLVDYLGNDDTVDSILLYIENLTNIRKFMSAARAVSLFKPIVVMKPGMQVKGAWSGMDFDSSVYDAAFKRAGIISVDSLDELFDCAELMAKQPRPKGDHLLVISNGNASGLKAMDAFTQCDMAPYELTTETVEALNDVLPHYWSRKNPINLLSGAGVESYVEAGKVCLKDRSINGILFTMAPEAGASPSQVAAGLVEVVKKARIPIMASWYGGRDMAGGIDIFNAARIPTFRTPEKAIRAFSLLLDYQRNRETILEIPAKLNQRLDIKQDAARTLMAKYAADDKSRMSLLDAGELISAYGIPCVPSQRVKDSEEAVAAANNLGYPVALKRLTSHSSKDSSADDAILNLKTPDQVENAFTKLISGKEDIELSLQPYLTSPDYKFLLGIKKDPLFGPVLLFGMGGIFSIILDELSHGLPPLNRLLARRLMEKSRAFHLLKGYRNRAPVQLEMLEELLIRLAQMAVDFPQIERLQINPLIIKEGKALALNARVNLQASSIQSPRHLVVSPYPKDQESTATAKNNLPLFIRPIRPEDTPLLDAFRKTLSEQSLYYRFFRKIREFTPEQLHRLTTIDYDREIALIALTTIDNEEKMIGVVRIKSHPSGQKGEFYISVSDDFQSHGIGSILLEKAFDVARKNGYQTIYGQVLQENEGMKKLAKKMGFDLKFNFDEKLFDIKMELK